MNRRTKIVTWNVNGLRAASRKSFSSFVAQEDPDILCLTEVRCHPLPGKWEQYVQFWNSAQKPGYSGVAIFIKEDIQPHRVDITFPCCQDEGRIITFEWNSLSLLVVYVPHSGIYYEKRMEWDRHLFELIDQKMSAGRSLVVAGDFNTAFYTWDYSDAKSPRANETPGFTDQERSNFGRLLERGLVDVFYHFHPSERHKHYTWYSARHPNRRVGMRLDYFLVTPDVIPLIHSIRTGQEERSSDHVPLIMEVD